METSAPSSQRLFCRISHHFGPTGISALTIFPNFVLPILEGTQTHQNLHSYSQDKRSPTQPNRLYFPQNFIEKSPGKNGERDENEKQNQWSYYSQRRVRCVSVGGLYRA